MGSRLIEYAKEGDLDALKELLDLGLPAAELNVQDDDFGETAISWAAERGYKEIVVTLFDHGANIDIADRGGRRPLYWAEMNGHGDIVSFLLDNTPDIQYRDIQNRTGLFAASEYGTVETVRRFLGTSEPVVDSRDPDEYTPLMYAARGGRAENIEALLQAKADKFLEDLYGSTALNHAARNGHAQAVDRLLEPGDTHSYINGNKPEARPLIGAAKNGNLETIKLLLERRADPTLPDDEGFTPLFWATQNGHLDVSQQLLRNGADIYSMGVSSDKSPLVALAAAMSGDENVWKSFQKEKPNLAVKGGDGKTALHIAAESGFLHAVELLANAGSEIDCRDSEGRTPLILASQKGHLASAQFLVDNGADAKLRDDEWEETPLMWAAENGHSEIVNLLCPLSDIEARGWGGNTALLWAAKRGSAESVDALLKHGADTHVTDERWGQSPVSWAAENGHLEAVKLLIRAGADLYSTESHGAAPIIFAVRTGSQMVQAFIEEPITGCEEPLPRVRTAELALRYAYEEQAERIITFIVEHDNYLTSADETGRNVVSWAAEHGLESEMEKLCARGLGLNQKDHRGRMPLSWAAGAGQMSALEQLFNNTAVAESFDQADEKERTPLSWAAGGGHEDVVEWLLGKGARADLEDKEGRTPLSRAAESGSAGAVKHILGQEVQADSSDKSKRTPLSWAAGRGNPETVEYLLGREDVKVDTRDCDSRTPLSWAAANGNREVAGLLLAKNASVDAKDVNNRTPLSWAAANGSHDVTSLLLDKNASVFAKDADNRTPLSWAAENGCDKTFQLLLGNGAVPDEADQQRRTPLSWAAAKGNLEVVTLLLAVRDGRGKATAAEMEDEGKTKSGRAKLKGDGVTTKSATQPTAESRPAKASTVEVNSRDKDLWTPLWHAAMNGHMPVIDVLLTHGADATAADREDLTLVEKLQKDKLEKEKLEREKLEKEKPEGSTSTDSNFAAILAKLIEYGSLHTKQSDDAIKVDGGFGTTIVYFLGKQGSNIETKTISVGDLLKGGQLRPTQGVSYQWLHLPANNMRWVEILMAKHYEACGDGEGWRFTVVLKPKRWARQQHIPRDQGHYHARFMRAACHPFDLQEQKGNTGESRGYVLFMPYLHWETGEELAKLKQVMQEKKSLRGDVEKSKKRTAEALRDDKLNGTQKLHWCYLNEDHPLHIRRTLDQFYYHTFPNTDVRDGDQTTLRYHKTKDRGLEKYRPVLTMVDQLWMWVLPGCGDSPPTVITAFPQRSNRMGSSRSKSTPTLISNIIEKCRELPECSTHELAKAIACECSRIYFDTMSTRNETLQFLEIYTTSIGEITDNETERFRRFQASIKLLNSSKSEGRDSRKDDPEVLKDLLNIEEDIEDLRQIKDIRDELNSVATVFHHQKEVVKAMADMFEAENGHSSGSKKDQQSYHSPLLDIVDRNISEVKRLEAFADRAAKAIEQLLDLKHKQANLVEEKLTRELTLGIYKLNSSIYEINSGTEKQGKTVMYFTVATIVFLPLSFMTSFLAIQVDEFPWVSQGHLSLSFVLKAIFAVSATIVVPSVIVAFNLDRTTRHQRVDRMTRPVRSAWLLLSWLWNGCRAYVSDALTKGWDRQTTRVTDTWARSRATYRLRRRRPGAAGQADDMGAAENGDVGKTAGVVVGEVSTDGATSRNGDEVK